MKRIPLATEGLAFILPFLALTLLALLMQWYVVAILLGVATLFFVNFFRDPSRSSDGAPLDLLSPADGTVISISEVDHPPWPALTKRITIATSIFDVYVNRAPATGEVVHYEYNPGRKIAPPKNEPSDQTEHSLIVMRLEDGSEIAMKQIGALLARRIVFDLDTGDRVARGERIGMIPFGSRVDVFVPPTAIVVPSVRDKVKVGQSVIATLARKGAR